MVDTYLVAERERWLLWLPVFLGLGIALYFSLPNEPNLWIGTLTSGLGIVAVALLASSRQRNLAFALLLLVTSIGFTVAQ